MTAAFIRANGKMETALTGFASAFARLGSSTSRDVRRRPIMRRESKTID